MPTVLFVEDNLAVLHMFPRLFRRDPFTVVTAPSAEAALEVVQTRPIDVVVSDHRMPGMLGAALLALLARDAPHIGRILLTGDLGTLTDEDASAVAHEVMRKPSAPNELRAAINRLLGGAGDGRADAPSTT